MRAGTRLGAFEVTGPLGAGGMGEVYRARDTRLGRDVALKTLPAAFASDPDRLMRFEREARALAALNHPYIAQVYGVEEGTDASGAPIRALVMELVEGEDLSERIRRGPVPLDEALAIARQIADALEAAHEQGIIHRDLKPANIKVREDGTVKVLDFGLAKALDAAPNPTSQIPSALANSPTITSPALTRAGGILGTAAYMAPEQAKGKPATKRSDIWAFGCVLYEMLTGRRAFAGEDISDTLANVLKSDPDWSRLPEATPTSVQRLLRRCIARDPKARLADIADARLELDGTSDPFTGARERRALRPLWRERVLWGLGLLIVGGVAGMVASRGGDLTTEPEMRVDLVTPPSIVEWDASIALSPDGRQKSPSSPTKADARSCGCGRSIRAGSGRLRERKVPARPSGRVIADRSGSSARPS